MVKYHTANQPYLMLIANGVVTRNRDCQCKHKFIFHDVEDFARFVALGRGKHQIALIKTPLALPPFCAKVANF
jgi:hypothetical protein